MKTIIFTAISFICVLSLHAQDIKSIDTTLKKIDKTVSEIKDELVAKKEEPYTGQSIFEDRKGGSAIFLPSGGTFRLNTADASLKFSFSNLVSSQKFFYGLEILGKTNDGLVSLISKGDISPGSKINGVIGFKEFFQSHDYLDGWLAFKFGYEGSSFKLFNPASSFADQIKKKSFNAFSSSIAFNLKMGGNKVLALSAGYQKANNYSELNEIELTDEKTFVDAGSSTTRSYESKTKVRTGNYEIFNQIPLNLDFFWSPNQSPRIGFYHYLRSKINNGKAVNGLGSGLYLLKKNNPLSSIAGIVFEVSDLSKLKEGYGKNFAVSFMVAFNFGFAK
ncbi:hypothetical protein [Pedobacter sp.]|uniref:hypothetical protein n=1 Tax=Pedobacter sp. TaxID=1411316 RepID=UPI0031E02F8A